MCTKPNKRADSVVGILPRYMTGCWKMQRLMLALLCAGLFPAFVHAAACTITVNNGGQSVVLENDAIECTYAVSSTTNDFQITRFINKATNTNMGILDGGTCRKNTGTATVTLNGAAKKTVHMVYGGGTDYCKDVVNTKDVTIYQTGSFVKLTYGINASLPTWLNSSHVWDYGGAGGNDGQFVIYGANEWLVARKASSARGDLCADGGKPYEYGGMDQSSLYPIYKKSYYCDSWGFGPASSTPLNYNGWLIMGVYRNNEGYGLVLPSANLNWLKLMAPPLQIGGFERIQTPPYACYYFLIPHGGAAEILTLGKAIADWAKGGEVGAPPTLGATGVKQSYLWAVSKKTAVDANPFQVFDLAGRLVFKSNGDIAEHLSGNRFFSAHGLFILRSEKNHAMVRIPIR